MGIDEGALHGLSSVEGVPSDADVIRNLAVILYQETNLPLHRIAEALGVSRGTVYNWLKLAGVSGDRRAGATTSDGIAAALPEEEIDTLSRTVDRLDTELRHLTRLVGENQSTLARLTGLLEGYLGRPE